MRILVALLFFLAGAAHADNCAKKLMPIFTSYQADRLCTTFAQGGTSVFTTQFAVPRVSATAGLLEQTKLLIDSSNHRIYFDESPAVPTGITADTGMYAFLSGNNQLENIVKVYNSGSGSSVGTLVEIHSTGTTGAVGGGAFVRYNDASTIGMGWHNDTGAFSWDADVLGSASGIGSGFDFSLNNKGTAANLRLQAGLDVIFGIGLSESVPEVARIGTYGLKFVNTGETIAIDSGTAASACKGTSTYNGTTAVTISTTCAATDMVVLHSPTSDPSGSTASQCWFTNVVNGTSFDIDCDSANDANFSWLIIKEG